MTKMGLEECRLHFQTGIDTARAFFGLGQDVKITLMNETPTNRDANAEILWMGSRLEACVRYDIDYLQRNPEKIWGAACHEVAHLVSRELMELKDSQAEKGKEFVPDFAQEYVLAIEKLTTRLERLFLRYFPDPLEAASAS